MNQVRVTGKVGVAIRTKFFSYSRRCVACRAISLQIFNGLCCKLTEIALFIYLTLKLG